MSNSSPEESSEARAPKTKVKVVPSYGGYAINHLDEIAEAISRGNIVAALEMLKPFYATLPTPVKEKLEENYLKIEIASEVARSQAGLTPYETLRLQIRAYRTLGDIYVLPFLGQLAHELYLRGYFEEDWDRINLGDLKDASKKRGARSEEL
jgi:hypothetical protein